MRLGLFGGTFDPVHLGHLLLAERCREECELDEVWFVPAHRPPHKSNATITEGVARCEMLEFATAGCPQFHVSQIELKREPPSYTVDTLAQLHADDPSRELFFLIGADSLNDLPTWREPERIAELATIVAVNRGEQQLRQAETLCSHLGEAIAKRVRLVTMPACDISSSNIRSRVAARKSVRFMIPRAVEVYIANKGLYRQVDR